MIYVTHDQVEAMTMADKIVVLQAGLVEQVGSPLELYHHPRNLFVAGFIGSPTMNFLKTEVRAAQADSVTVGLPGGGSITVPVKPGKCRPGDKVTLGVRPEHLLEGGGGDGELKGVVLVVERLGGATYCYLKLEDDTTLHCRSRGQQPCQGWRAARPRCQQRDLSPLRCRWRGPGASRAPSPGRCRSGPADCPLVIFRKEASDKTRRSYSYDHSRRLGNSTFNGLRF